MSAPPLRSSTTPGKDRSLSETQLPPLRNGTVKLPLQRVKGRTCVKGFDGVPLPWEHPPRERAPPPPCFRAPKAPRGAVTSPHQLLSTGPACPLWGSRARPRREEQGRVLASPPHSGCPHVATAAGDETNPHRSTPSRVLISGYNSLFPDP